MTRIVLIGAGSLQFGAQLLGDIFKSEELEGSEIVFNDINPDAVEKTRKLAQDYIDANGLDFTISVDGDLAGALKGARFVVVMIEVGDRFKLWEMDWKIPLQYGIAQVYGENGGPGGLFHALRIIPPILEICGKVAEIAPDATIFNFSNPMSRICTTVHRKFPQLHFVGLCHEIASLERHLPPMLSQPRSNIRYRAAGLNHFSVLAEVKYVDSGKDAYPDVLERAPGYFSRLPGYSEILAATRHDGSSIATEGWMSIEFDHTENVREWSDRWLFREVLERFGVLPITTDSHFGEYIAWAYQVSDHRGILDFFTYYRDYLGSVEPAIKNEASERMVPVMEAMLTGCAYEEAAVNIPNSGFIENLPDWIAVEVPAIVDSNGISGIPVQLPAGVRGLLTNQIGIHDLVASAILEQSRELVVQAVLVDPVVSRSKEAPTLVDHMISVQQPWLDYLR
ncbi:MAG: hypothetical protein OXI87_23800 [Albidovulum sp.]|nr:hypothetical protein [Albidovulum sp.]MDE0307881.1 hypothetical protein [Albidovulum sp.]